MEDVGQKEYAKERRHLDFRPSSPLFFCGAFCAWIWTRRWFLRHGSSGNNRIGSKARRKQPHRIRRTARTTASDQKDGTDPLSHLGIATDWVQPCMNWCTQLFGSSTHDADDNAQASPDADAISDDRRRFRQDQLVQAIVVVRGDLQRRLQCADVVRTSLPILDETIYGLYLMSTVFWAYSQLAVRHAFPAAFEIVCCCALFWTDKNCLFSTIFSQGVKAKTDRPTAHYDAV